MAKIQEKGNTKLRYYISMDLKENTEKSLFHGTTCKRWKTTSRKRK